MHFTLALCVLAVSASFANGQSCRLPNNDKGTCMNIYQCDIMYNMITKKNRTAKDNQFLTSSKCGSDGDAPKVCCPESEKLSCLTPENRPGECVSMQKCTHLAYSSARGVEKAITEGTISVCAGPEENSICCQSLDADSCESAFPPDPDSDCCGLDTSIQKKILNGEETAIDEYPWLVVIEYIKLGELKLLCGGSLISSRYVLTAGHCVKGRILQIGTPKNVRLGEYNTTNDGPDCVPGDGGDPECTLDMMLVPIEELIPHPSYLNENNFHQQHDIALIRLASAAPRTEFIRPICLPKVDYAKTLPSNYSLSVAGWGVYYFHQEKSIYMDSDVKRFVNVPLVKNEICQEIYNNERPLQTYKDVNVNIEKAGQICAGGEVDKDS